MAETWGSQPLDFNQDSKRVFTNLLIWHVKEIGMRLYYGSRPSQALQPLCCLIDVLDDSSKKKLHDKYEKLQNFYCTSTKWSRQELQEIFSDVLSYLHQTFLKEVNYARPIRPSRERMRVPE